MEEEIESAGDGPGRELATRAGAGTSALREGPAEYTFKGSVRR